MFVRRDDSPLFSYTNGSISRKEMCLTEKHIGEYAAAFLLGFFLYAMLEIAGRGYTHWSMGILGGGTLALLYHMELRIPSRPMRALLGGCFVTAAEFTCGVCENLILGWEIWDYSDLHIQLLGQISLLFSLLWIALCFLATFLCSLLYRQYHG